MKLSQNPQVLKSVKTGPTFFYNQFHVEWSWKYTSGLLELKDDEKQQIIIPLQFSDMNF